MEKIENLALYHPFGLSFSSEKLVEFLFENEIDPTLEIEEGVWLYKTQHFTFIHFSQEESFHINPYSIKGSYYSTRSVEVLVGDIIYELTLSC